MRWRRHQQAHLRHGGTVQILPHAHEMVAPHLGGAKDIERRAADEPTMVCRWRTDRLAKAHGLCNVVRNLTLYATFGTSSRTARRVRPLRLTPQEEERHGARMHRRREDRTGNIRQRSSSASHTVTSVCNYITNPRWQPRQHPSSTMIDGTITIHGFHPRSTD